MVERFTAHHHLRASLALGCAQGVFTLNEYVAKNELGATRWHIVALGLAPALAQTLSSVRNPVRPGHLFGRRPFRVLGIGFHMPVALLGIVAALGLGIAPTAFVAVLALASIGGALLTPTQGAILSNNYPAARRSSRYASAVSVHALGLVVVGLPLGWALDTHIVEWPLAYLLGSALAALGYARWGKMRRRRPPPVPPDLPVWNSPWRVLFRDKRFLAFEIAFMVYGTGFLALQPVLPLYLIEELNAGYTEAAFARGTLFTLAMVVASPIMGRVGDRYGVLRLGALGFVILALFAGILLTWRDMTGVFVAFAVYGVAMACVNVSWNLGPIALAQGRDPLPYLKAHIGLIGIRATIGMVAGSAIQAAFGSLVVFAGVLGLEIIAATIMLFTAGIGRPPWRLRGARAAALVPPPAETNAPPAP